MPDRSGANQQAGSGIVAVMFDFGGVLAEEGFREGLMAIGRSGGLIPERFFMEAAEIAYESGYVTGRTNESAFWDTLRKRTGISGSDRELRREVLDRFVLRPWVLESVELLRSKGFLTAILSDQTDWLDELDRKHGFFRYFHSVFNSFHLGNTKRNPSIFLDVTKTLGVSPTETLFIDDNPGNCERAESKGLRTILYQDKEGFIEDLAAICSLDSNAAV
jgi:putative hydrolase of the HAD superfamily